MSGEAGPFIIFDCKSKDRVLAVASPPPNNPTEPSPKKTLQLRRLHKTIHAAATHDSNQGNCLPKTEDCLAWQSQQWRIDSKCLVNVAYPNLCVDATCEDETYTVAVRKTDYKQQRVLVVPIEGSKLDGCLIQTAKGKYLTSRRSLVDPSRLRQAPAARKEFVLWRLVTPADVLQQNRRASAAVLCEPESCEIEFNFLDDEEIKVAPMTKTLVENASRSAAASCKNLVGTGITQQAQQKTFVEVDELVATVYAPTSDTIDAGRRTLIEKLMENRPQIVLPSSFTASVTSQEGALDQFLPKDREIVVEEVEWGDSDVDQTKKVLASQIGPPNAPVCQDDICDPIPIEIFILIGINKKDLFDYCRMRIFNTLFTWNELEGCLREIIWPKLMRIDDYSSRNYHSLYWRLVAAPCPELDEKIHQDEARKRFKVRTQVTGIMIEADEDKLERVLHAYGVFDPEVFYKQGYVFVVTLLFHYLHDEESVFFALCWIMHSLNWRAHFIEPFPRMEIITTELRHYITFSLPRLAKKFEEDGALMLQMALETLYDFVFPNITVAGEQAGLPVEVSRRVFELVIFEGFGDDSLSRMLVYILMIEQEKVLQMSGGDRFRYIGHGRFIADCFLDEELFTKLIDLLRIDQEQMIREEQRLSIKSEPGQSLTYDEGSFVRLNINSMQREIDEAERSFMMKGSVASICRQGVQSGALINSATQERNKTVEEISNPMAQSQRQGKVSNKPAN